MGEDQFEMIGKLQDLISYGRRRFQENQLLRNEEEESLEREDFGKPVPMQFQHKEQVSRKDVLDKSSEETEEEEETGVAEEKEEEKTNEINSEEQEETEEESEEENERLGE